MSQKPPHRRFIAGAVCPACGEMDKIAIEPGVSDGADERLCVQCGFRESRPQGDPVADKPQLQPMTRVTRPAARRVETPAQVVTLIDQAEKD